MLGTILNYHLNYIIKVRVGSVYVRNLQEMRKIYTKIYSVVQRFIMMVRNNRVQ